MHQSKTVSQEEFLSLFPDAAPSARKLWLINVDKVYHRRAQKLVDKEFEGKTTKKAKKGKK